MVGGAAAEALAKVVLGFLGFWRLAALALAAVTDFFETCLAEALAGLLLADVTMTLGALGVGLVVQYHLPLANAQAWPSAAEP